MARRKAVYVAALLALAFGAGRGQADSFRVTVLPEHPTSDQPIHLILSGTTTNYCTAGFTPPVRQGDLITIGFSPPLLPVTPGCTGPWTVQFDLAPLPAGAYSVQVGGEPPLAAATFDVFPSPELAKPLLLQSRRFGVDLRWGAGFGRTADFVQWSNESGLFSFFDDKNVEVTVKVLDGRAVNGHFWVFIASMTDLPFTVTLTDRLDPVCATQGPCPSRTYTSPGGKNTNFIDVNAF